MPNNIATPPNFSRPSPVAQPNGAAFITALDLDRDSTPAPDEPLEPVPPWSVCAPVATGMSTKTAIPYHVLVEALTPRFDRIVTGSEPTLGGNPLDLSAFSVSVVADVEIAQSWLLMEMVRGDVAATLPLAPAEKITFRMLRSQRTRMDRKVVESKEEIRKSEATTSDKEVMEATRNVSRNEGFNVSGSAGVSVGFVNASASAGYQASIAEQAQSSLQHVSEATKKASNQLKTLSKIEVSETTDVTTVNEQVRTLSNPYHDRSMLVVVYELLKRYRVTHEVTRVHPALALSAKLELDDRFVLRNVDFLERTLLDRQLAGDLPAVLSMQTQRIETTAPDRLLELINLGFYYLFDASNVYFLNEDLNRVGPVPEFDVHRSFDATQDPSGWDDARNKAKANELFLVLTMLFRIWWKLEGRTTPVWLFQDPNIPPVRDEARLKIDLFRVLTKEIKKHWSQIAGSDLAALFDESSRTEIFRRIPGFLALSENLVMPALGEAGSSDDVLKEPDMRPALVVGRIVEHLRAFESYYTERFFEYLDNATAGHAHRTLFHDAITRSLAGLDAAARRLLLARFDPRRGYLDGTRFIIPYHGDAPSEVLAAAFGLVTDPDGTGDLGFRFPTYVSDIEIPADGGQIEAVAGECVLSNVPKPCCPSKPCGSAGTEPPPVSEDDSTPAQSS